MIHFSIATAFAAQHQLGWDTTMSRVETPDGPQYEISVFPAETEPVVYRTRGVLYDKGEFAELFGRGTRVWKAVRIINGEEVGGTVALKDVWVDCARPKQGDIHSQILQSPYLSENKEMREYILAIEHHGDVVVNGAKDYTLLIAPSSAGRLDGDDHFAPTGAIPACPSPSRSVHYRLVFAAVGTPLTEVRSLHTIFIALADAVYGRYILIPQLLTHN